MRILNSCGLKFVKACILSQRKSCLSKDSDELVVKSIANNSISVRELSHLKRIAISSLLNVDEPSRGRSLVWIRGYETLILDQVLIHFYKY